MVSAHGLIYHAFLLFFPQQRCSKVLSSWGNVRLPMSLLHLTSTWILGKFLLERYDGWINQLHDLCKQVCSIYTVAVFKAFGSPSINYSINIAMEFHGFPVRKWSTSFCMLLEGNQYNEYLPSIFAELGGRIRYTKECLMMTGGNSVSESHYLKVLGALTPQRKHTGFTQLLCLGLR